MDKEKLDLVLCGIESPAFGVAPAWPDHGLLWGDGNVVSLACESLEDTCWVVMEVARQNIEKLNSCSGLCRFHDGRVVYLGNSQGARDYIAAHGGEEEGRVLPWASKELDDGQVCSVGSCGSVVAGYDCCVAARDHSKVTLGADGVASVGYSGCVSSPGYGNVVSAGLGGSVVAGSGSIVAVKQQGDVIAGAASIVAMGAFGNVSVGEDSTAVVGSEGTVVVGDRGIAVAGEGGTAVAGIQGVAAACGLKGTAQAGVGGIVLLMYGEPLKAVIGRVGQDGILPDTPYRVEEDADGDVS